MKMRNLPLILGALVAGASASHATLLTWQSEVGAGTAPASTLFSTVDGAAPVTFNVGALAGDRSFEFIVNSGAGGDSQALIGSLVVGATGRQGLKFEQWQNTGMYGVTDFGVADFVSTIPYDINRDVHIVFTSDGTTNTSMFIDGTLRDTFPTPLRMTGNQGIGAALNATATGYIDNLAGNILGFASYDSALSPSEITAHYNAFTVIPEPAAAALLALGALGMIRRRRVAHSS
jgi:hypothetical protein